ncbi:MAG: hypothetical protein SFW65_10425 [Alphaproteobacteria bacterium]|nr:hypothetical protein [Alphaproteobacteria bacterium]
MNEQRLEDLALVRKAPRYSPVLVPLSVKSVEQYRRRASAKERRWLRNNFDPETKEAAYRYNAQDRIARAYVPVSDDYIDHERVKTLYDDRFMLSGWVDNLGEGTYKLSSKLRLSSMQAHNLAFGWGAAAYRFDKYKSKRKPRKTFLEIPEGADAAKLQRELNATCFVQDLINEPSNIMNCEGLTNEARALAKKYGASISVIQGKKLAEANYPLIYAVGKASEEEPRLIDMEWGDPSHPRITLVGKGVVFDTGGINAKYEDQMRDMKYDMAGAAHALGTAYMIMDANLPVRLRVLLPVVENANGPKGYKQGDVLKTRKGETLEVTHTDAEGRLILSDALYEAAHPVSPEHKRPDLIIGFGTTGWHGFTEFPGWGSVYSNRKPVQEQFMRCAAECQEYFTARPFLKPLQNELRAAHSSAELIQSAEGHQRYDDLMVFSLLHMQVESVLGEKGREAPFVYMDLAPFREANSTATQYPPDLPTGGFAMGVRSSFRLVEQHCQ